MKYLHFSLQISIDAVHDLVPIQILTVLFQQSIPPTHTYVTSDSTLYHTKRKLMFLDIKCLWFFDELAEWRLIETSDFLAIIHLLSFVILKSEIPGVLSGASIY